MCMNIVEFPQDVLLELAKQLNVRDLLSFLSVQFDSCVRAATNLTSSQDLTRHPRASVSKVPLARGSLPDKGDGITTTSSVDCRFT
jgi:hypothetical protein